MNAYWLPSGNIMAPFAVESEDGVLGDGMVELEQGTEEWHRWAPHAKGLPPESVEQHGADS